MSIRYLLDENPDSSTYGKINQVYLPEASHPPQSQWNVIYCKYGGSFLASIPSNTNPQNNTILQTTSGNFVQFQPSANFTTIKVDMAFYFEIDVNVSVAPLPEYLNVQFFAVNAQITQSQYKWANAPPLNPIPQMLIKLQAVNSPTSGRYIGSASYVDYMNYTTNEIQPNIYSSLLTPKYNPDGSAFTASITTNTSTSYLTVSASYTPCIEA